MYIELDEYNPRHVEAYQKLLTDSKLTKADGITRNEFVRAQLNNYIVDLLLGDAFTEASKKEMASLTAEIAKLKTVIERQPKLVQQARTYLDETAARELAHYSKMPRLDVPPEVQAVDFFAEQQRKINKQLSSSQEDLAPEIKGDKQ